MPDSTDPSITDISTIYTLLPERSINEKLEIVEFENGEIEEKKDVVQAGDLELIGATISNIKKEVEETS